MGHRTHLAVVAVLAGALGAGGTQAVEALTAEAPAPRVLACDDLDSWECRGDRLVGVEGRAELLADQLAVASTRVSDLEVRVSQLEGEGRPTPEPTQTPTVTPSPTQAAPFPTAADTGVPPGTALTGSGAPLTITTAGTVVDGRNLGCVDVKADDVTIRRSKVTCDRSTPAIRTYNGPGTGLLVEDVEITGGADSGIGFRGYIAHRVNVHDVVDGLKMEDATTLEDSYVHHLRRTSTSHADCVQSMTGSGIRVVGNSLQAYNPATDDPQNAVLQATDTTGQTRNLTFEDNLVNGGNYTLNVKITGPGSFRGNRFGRDFRYGPVNAMSVSFDRTNVWHDSGLPVR